MQAKQAPVNLNLLSIRQPVTAVVSILHRVTGLVLFLALPLCLYLLQQAIASPRSYALLQQSIAASMLLRLALLLVAVAAVHHLVAGIRYLLLDIDIAIQRQAARSFSWLILAVDVVALLLLGWRIL